MKHSICQFHDKLSQMLDIVKDSLLYFVFVRFQKIFIDELDLKDNIAKNKALRENLFMMVVCIELRIPLFIIGKPGSSKSLAKTIIQDNMQGNSSRSLLFKNFKRVSY